MTHPIAQRPGRCRGVRRHSLAKERLALREATPPVAPRLVARAPGKETLSFRSDGIDPTGFPDALDGACEGKQDSRMTLRFWAEQLEEWDGGPTC